MGIFIDSLRRRPRAFWRLLVQFSLYFLLSLVMATLFSAPFLLLGGSAGPSSGLAFAYIATSVGGLVAALITLLITARFVDRRRFSDYGFHLNGGWFLDLGFGLALGALLMCAIFITQLSLGWISVTGTFYSGFDGVPFILGILPPAIVFLCVGVYEEANSRGYQMKNLSEGLNFAAIGPRGAVIASWIITSVLFGLLHLGNPNSSLLSTLNISLAGILLGVGYVLTGELAIPIGVHITWNFFQGSVFGFPVSGLTGLGGSFITVEQSGPEAWTGGEFGPEAGLLDPIAVVLGCLATFMWVRWRRGRAGIFTGIADPDASANGHRKRDGATT